MTANNERSIESRAIAALAAKLMLPTLDEDAAAKLAQTEGLVTHLTSLVLVDQAGAVQASVPATRKIALPSPAGRGLAMSLRGSMLADYAQIAGEPVPDRFKQLIRSLDATADAEPMPAAQPSSDAGRQQAETRRGSEREARRGSEREARRRGAEEQRRAKSAATSAATSAAAARPAEPSSGRWLPRLARLFGSSATASSSSNAMAALAGRIDWDAAPQRLQAGDLADLDAAVAAEIRRIAAQPWAIKEAADAGCDPVVLVIALLARTVAHRSRTADRIARVILG